MLRYLHSHALAFTGENIDMFFKHSGCTINTIWMGWICTCLGIYGWERGNYRFAHLKLGGVLLDGFVE
jgi:hypothetical protein